MHVWTETIALSTISDVLHIWLASTVILADYKGVICNNLVFQFNMRSKKYIKHDPVFSFAMK
jgi:hypothetical protein